VPDSFPVMACVNLLRTTAATQAMAWLITSPLMLQSNQCRGLSVNEIDIWRTAHLLMKQHGHDAGFVAAQRADALLAAGDHLGCSVFVKIVRAIETLRCETPHEGEAVN
jgi:hypothetical protein